MLQIDNKNNYQINMANDLYTDLKLQNASLKLPKIIKNQQKYNKKQRINGIHSQIRNNSKFPIIRKPSRQQNIRIESNIHQSSQKLLRFHSSNYDKNSELTSEKMLTYQKGYQVTQNQQHQSEQEIKNPQNMIDILEDNSINHSPQEIYKDEFINEVQEKLKKVLQNNDIDDNKKTQDLQHQKSQMSDFEQKILENKQFIKKQKKKIENDKKIKKKYRRSENKNSSLYQKRIKQYKQNSENRYLKEKKKQYALKQFKQKEQKEIEKIKVPKKQQQRNIKKLIQGTSRYSANLYKIKQSKKNKFVQKQQLQKQQPFHLNSENIFEDIQTILQYPHKSRSEFLSLNKIKMMKSHNIRQKMQELQKKYTFLQKQEKLQECQSGNKSEQFRYQRGTYIIDKKLRRPHQNLFNWNRISILQNKQLKFIQSNFTNQVERINDYLTKNEKSIESYLYNQQFLLELQLQKKMKDIKKKNINRTQISSSNN